MLNSYQLVKRVIGFVLGFIILLNGLACRPQVVSLEEAVQQTSKRIDRVVTEWHNQRGEINVIFPQTSCDNPNQLTFWFFSHPLVAPPFIHSAQKKQFEEKNPDILVEPLFLGEWVYALQKLTIALAANETPDVALVKREWLGALLESGRICPIEMISPTLVDDLSEHFRQSMTVNHMVFALPADGFLTVLFANKDFTGDSIPQTWDDLFTLAKQLRAQCSDSNFYPIGHLPFLELFWSCGGKVDFESDTQVLSSTEAVETLRFLKMLKENKLIHPSVFHDQSAGIELFLKKRVAMTVASSMYLGECKSAPFPLSFSAIPGKLHPVSSLSDNVLVVFSANAEAKRTAIARLLDYLTGADIQGMRAYEHGSMPVRKSVLQTLPETEIMKNLIPVALASPLVRPWGIIEDEFSRMLIISGF